MDDLEEDEKALHDAINNPNISQIDAIKKENEKLAKQILKNFNDNKNVYPIANDQINQKNGLKPGTEFKPDLFIMNSSSSSHSSTTVDEKFPKNNSKSDIPNSALNILTYNSKCLLITSTKVNSQTYINFVWLEYKMQKIDKHEARSLTCKLNSAQIADQKFIEKIYIKFGILTSSLQCFINCLQIINDNNFSVEDKFREVSKNVAGTYWLNMEVLKHLNQLENYQRK